MRNPIKHEDKIFRGCSSNKEESSLNTGSAYPFVARSGIDNFDVIIHPCATEMWLLLGFVKGMQNLSQNSMSCSCQSLSFSKEEKALLITFGNICPPLRNVPYLA